MGGPLVSGADVRAWAVDEFNAACVPGHFDSTIHDDCHTRGLEPPKSHWARPIVGKRPPDVTWDRLG